MENKQFVLESESKQRGLDVPKVLPAEKKKLNEKATRMAYAYSRIIYTNKSINKKEMIGNKCKSFMYFKAKIMENQDADQNFYDTLVIFSSQVLKEAFDPSELMKLEEEINRLYRTNAFNITERKMHHE